MGNAPSVALAIRFCKRLSAEERNRLKGTAVANRDKDLFAIAEHRRHPAEDGGDIRALGRREARALPV